MSAFRENWDWLGAKKDESADVDDGITVISKHSTQNGWHRAVVETASQRTGAVCRYAVRWRTQTFLCHYGSDFLDIHDNVWQGPLGQVGTKVAEVPVVSSDADGGVAPIAHRCEPCGAVRAAKVAINRMEATP